MHHSHPIWQYGGALIFFLYFWKLIFEEGSFTSIFNVQEHSKFDFTRLLYLLTVKNHIVIVYKSILSLVLEML